MAHQDLDLKYAQELARSLKGVPSFPWDEEVILAVAADLVRWCKGIIGNPMVTPAAQALWLITETRERSEKRWIGPGAMLKLLREKYPSAEKSLGPEYEVIDLGEKPPVICSLCTDWGTLKGRNGRHYFCDCGAGQHLKTELGNSWLDYCDGKRTVKSVDIPVAAGYEPSPGVDERPYPPLDAKTGRCAQCNGWGRSGNCYCSCQLGRDLERVERQTKARAQRLAEENPEGPIQ